MLSRRTALAVPLALPLVLPRRPSLELARLAVAWDAAEREWERADRCGTPAEDEAASRRLALASVALAAWMRRRGARAVVAGSRLYVLTGACDCRGGLWEWSPPEILAVDLAEVAGL